MKKLNIWLIIILSGTLCFTSGCWDSKSLETLDIPIAAGYDCIENIESDKKEMEIYAVIPIFYENTPEKYIIDITKGTFVGETRTNRRDHMGEELSLGSFQVSVIGYTLAEYGARDVLNIITRTPEMKKTTSFAVAEKDAKSIFMVEPDNYPNIGVYLDTLLDAGTIESFIPKSTVHNFIISMDTPGWHPIAPILKAQDNNIYISGYAIFTEDKLTHAISLPEARILNLLRNLSASDQWSYSFIHKDLPYSASVKMSNNARIKVSYNKDGYAFDVDIKSSGTLVELIPNSNYKTFNNNLSKKNSLIKNKELMKSAEKGYRDYITQQINALIDKAQNTFRMDIFNWIKYAQAKWRKEVNDANWDYIFSESKVNVNVKVSFEYIGEQT